MKKVISTMAIFVAASSAQAFRGPDNRQNEPKPKPRDPSVACIEVTPSEYQEGTVRLGSCDMTRANNFFGRELNKDGCRDGQLAIRTKTVKVESCPSPVQL
jgi:hypothetical protein